MSLPNSANFFKQFDMGPQELRAMLTQIQSLPESYVRTLTQYKLLCWNKELLSHKLKQGGGNKISRFDTDFQVYWDESQQPTARSQYVAASKDSQWWLSFRIPHPDSGLLPVVFISHKKSYPSLSL